MNQNTSITIVLVVFILCIFSPIVLLKEEPKIVLPEEINQVKATDTLRGYYDSNGTLHIEYNNQRNRNR